MKKRNPDEQQTWALRMVKPPSFQFTLAIVCVCVWKGGGGPFRLVWSLLSLSPRGLVPVLLSGGAGLGVA